MKYTVLIAIIVFNFSIKNSALAANQVLSPIIETTGVIEIETSYNQPYSGQTTSSLNLAKIELGLNTHVNEQMSVEVILLHEEDNLEIDVATLNFSLNESNWQFTAGQTYLPFGDFSTFMVSDPLTLEVAETRETAVQLNYESDHYTSAFYVFNGSNKQNNGTADKVDNFGLNFGYKLKNDLAFSANISYINDIGDSNSLQDAIKTNLGNNNVMKHVAGIGASAILEINNIHFITEYISAIENFSSNELSYNGQGAKPTALNVELGYSFSLLEKATTVGIAFQTTDQALGLGLPKSSLSTAIMFSVLERTSLAFEILNKKDYSISNGGTGKTSKALTVKLTAEF